MNRKGYQKRRAFSSNNGEEETMVFDTSKPPEPRVYMAREIQQLLGLGKNKTYEYLEQVYQKQSPFRVIKVGRLYFREGSGWTHRVKILQPDGSTKYSKRGGFGTREEAERGNLYAKD